MMEKTVLSVSELNDHIKTVLDCDALLNDVAVRGELSNYKIYPSGHHYFNMKDAEGALKCVMFKTSAMRLRFRPENGMMVTAFGRVSVYPRDGAYQLYCTGIMPEGTGDLQLAFEQLKQKLSQEGLFDASHKKPLPAFPGRIAIITSSAGAAVHDMIRILSHRWPMSKVLLLPVRVQGAEAPAEIVGAIRYANRYKIADLIITGRGGGSIEDLWAFNDERVARAIFDSEIPVISAVGHEPDVTISDYVADRRASTPSNAAEIAVPDMGEIRDILSAYEIRMGESMRKKLSLLSQRLDSLSSRRVLNDPSVYISGRRLELDRRSDRLIASMDAICADKKRTLSTLAASLDAMSPLRVLSRGYSITSHAGGEVVKSASELKPGDTVKITLYRGSALCRVETAEEQ